MKAGSRSCTLPTWNRLYQLSSLHDCLNQLIGWVFFSLFFPCELLLLKVQKKRQATWLSLPERRQQQQRQLQEQLRHLGEKEVGQLLLQVKDLNTSGILMTFSLTLGGGHTGVNAPPPGLHVFD